MAKRYNPRDHYFQKAKQDRFVARSIYKLEEIDRRYQLFNRGDRVVDLGAAPGSWLQYVAKKVGKKGCVIGYDLEVAGVGAPNAELVVADVTALDPNRVRKDVADLVSRLKGKTPEATVPPGFRIDAVISDMAPKLTGIRDADQARSAALVEHALALAAAIVKPGGYFVAKLFQGRDSDALVEKVKGVFKEVKLLKPDATREGSREVFVVGLNRRTPHPPR